MDCWWMGARSAPGAGACLFGGGLSFPGRADKQAGHQHSPADMAGHPHAPADKKAGHQHSPAGAWTPARCPQSPPSWDPWPTHPTAAPGTKSAAARTRSLTRTTGCPAARAPARPNLHACRPPRTTPGAVAVRPRRSHPPPCPSLPSAPIPPPPPPHHHLLGCRAWPGTWHGNAADQPTHTSGVQAASSRPTCTKPVLQGGGQAGQQPRQQGAMRGQPAPAGARHPCRLLQPCMQGASQPASSRIPPIARSAVTTPGSPDQAQAVWHGLESDAQ